jgi:hypothetical protein
MKNKTKSMFKIGEYVKLLSPITDYDPKQQRIILIFPPPTIVIIKKINKRDWQCYGIMAVKEKELPIRLQGNQFRTVMSNCKSEGLIKVIGKSNIFLNGDEEIEQRHFDTIHYVPEIYIEKIKS